MHTSAKPVIFIGGASGGGKTTLGRELSTKLAIDHRIGGGFVRAILQSTTTPEETPELFSFTFDGEDPVATLKAQAVIMKPAIATCVKRARLEGTSLIMESPHFSPEIFTDLEPDVFIILLAPDQDEHDRRIDGDSHRFRKVGDVQRANIRKIDKYYRSVASGPICLPTTYGDNLDEIVSLVQEKLA